MVNPKTSMCSVCINIYRNPKLKTLYSTPTDVYKYIHIIITSYFDYNSLTNRPYIL